MRLAVISDIHGNLPALESVLTEIRNLAVERLYCLGDVVGYGPYPNECIDLVRSSCHSVVQGNHDSAVVGVTPLSDFNEYGRDAIQWTKKIITAENSGYLQSLPLKLELTPATLVHASPVRPEAWTYVLTTRIAEENLKGFTTDICFIGHTHVPIVVGDDGTINAFRSPHPTVATSRRYLINVGSVGQPRDGDPRAAFGFLDTDSWTYELFRVEYDNERTADAIKKSGLPRFLAKRLFSGV